MREETRDNLIYLSVGIGIGALIVADTLYAEGRGQKALMPSRFAARAVTSSLLVGYFVVREIRKLRLSKLAVIGFLCLGAIAHAAVLVAFRESISSMPGLTYVGVASIEIMLLLGALLLLANGLKTAH